MLSFLLVNFNYFRKHLFQKGDRKLDDTFYKSDCDWKYVTTQIKKR